MQPEIKEVGQNKEIKIYDVVLGTGKHGSIYKCEMDQINRVVKILKTKYSQVKNTIQYDQRQLGSIEKYPLIANFYKEVIFQDNIYIITQLCQGNPLFQEIKFGLQEGRIFHYAYQIIQAVEYLHITDKIIHGDIKPKNIIILSKDNSIKLTDTGLAKAMSGSQAFLKEKEDALIYSCPSLLQKLQYDFSCDVWSLGIILLEMFKVNICEKDSSIHSIISLQNSIQQKLNNIFSEKKQEFSQFWKNVIKKCLQPNDRKRAKIDQIKNLFSVQAQQRNYSQRVRKNIKIIKKNGTKQDLFKQDQEIKQRQIPTMDTVQTIQKNKQIIQQKCDQAQQLINGFSELNDLNMLFVKRLNNGYPKCNRYMYLISLLSLGWSYYQCKLFLDWFSQSSIALFNGQTLQLKNVPQNHSLLKKLRQIVYQYNKKIKAIQENLYQIQAKIKSYLSEKNGIQNPNNAIFKRNKLIIKMVMDYNYKEKIPCQFAFSNSYIQFFEREGKIQFQQLNLKTFDKLSIMKNYALQLIISKKKYFFQQKRSSFSKRIEQKNNLFGQKWDHNNQKILDIINKMQENQLIEFFQRVQKLNKNDLTKVE